MYWVTRSLRIGIVTHRAFSKAHFLKGTERTPAGFSPSMPDLVPAIEEEIRSVEAAMEKQRRLMKKSLGNATIVEAAEHELKALHARLATLKANLRKEQSRLKP